MALITVCHTPDRWTVKRPVSLKVREKMGHFQFVGVRSVPTAHHAALLLVFH